MASTDVGTVLCRRRSSPQGLGASCRVQELPAGARSSPQGARGFPQKSQVRFSQKKQTLFNVFSVTMLYHVTLPCCHVVLPCYHIAATMLPRYHMAATMLPYGCYHVTHWLPCYQLCVAMFLLPCYHVTMCYHVTKNVSRRCLFNGNKSVFAMQLKIL